MVREMMLADMDELLEALMPAVYAAGDEVMRIHQGTVEQRLKADGSPVSEADEAAEAILLPAIQAAAPDITIISEESAASHHLAPASSFFLVDPIDGTKEFLKADGTGAFTVNIGLIQDAMPVMGLVYAPAFETLYGGIVGQKAFKSQNRKAREAIKVRAVPPSGAVAVASASHRDEATNQWLAAHAIAETRAIGSSLKFCLLAEGLADVYPRFGPTMEWDTAAGDAVLRAAGGMVFGPDEAPFAYGKAGYRNGAFVATGTWKR